MRRFLVLVRPNPELNLYELHVLGTGVTQAGSHQDFEPMARDLVELVRSPEAAAAAEFDFLFADRC